MIMAETVPLPDLTDEALLRARLTAYLEGVTGQTLTLGEFKRFDGNGPALPLPRTRPNSRGEDADNSLCIASNSDQCR